MKTVVFACVHNAGRSQMAAAWFNHINSQLPTPNSQLPTSNSGLPPVTYRAVSAGTAPAERVHPEVIEVMREVGVDLSATRPQRLTDDLARGAALLITMGCGDQCPYVPGLEIEDWPLEDPKGKPVERVREIRDEIRDRVQELIARL